MNIYDISKQAGVSIATVSRVLNGNSNVSDKTRHKVLSVIEECDYTPNVFARGLGLNTMNAIGIMCSDSSDTYLANAVYYLEHELRRHGYDSILCCTGYALEDKKKYMQLLLTKRVDAIILTGSSFLDMKHQNNQYILDAASQIPIMLMNGYLKSPNIFSVVCDDRQAVSDICKRLFSQGRRRILFLYHSASYSGIEKLTGYKDACIRCHVPIDEQLIQKCPKDLPSIQQFITSLYDNGLRFDAVVASEDIMGIGAIKFARDRHITIPKQLSIVGFNNSLPAQCCEPELTSIDNQVRSLSKTCVLTLMQVLQHLDVPEKTMLLADLVERATTDF